MRLQLSVLAYNLGNLWAQLGKRLRTKSWSLTSLQHGLVKTGGRLVKHAIEARRGRGVGKIGLQSVPGSTRPEPPGAGELDTACDEDIWTCRGGGCIRSAFE